MVTGVKKETFVNCNVLWDSCERPFSVVGGVGRRGGGGKRGLFKFKGAVNLINLNILDKPVKTL